MNGRLEINTATYFAGADSGQPERKYTLTSDGAATGIFQMMADHLAIIAAETRAFGRLFFVEGAEAAVAKNEYILIVSAHGMFFERIAADELHAELVAAFEKHGRPMQYTTCVDTKGAVIWRRPGPKSVPLSDEVWNALYR